MKQLELKAFCSLYEMTEFIQVAAGGSCDVGKTNFKIRLRYGDGI